MAANISRSRYLHVGLLIFCLSSSFHSVASSLFNPEPSPILPKFYNGTGCLRIPSIPNLGYCGIPYELSNFQGLLGCSPDTGMARPRDVSEVSELVKQFARVKAVGTGLSWNKEQFCAGPDTTSLNIAMTEIDSLQPLFTQNPPEWKVDSPDFPIQVDAKAGTVTVAAGVPLRTLLNFLAFGDLIRNKCDFLPLSKLPKCGAGYFLKMVPQILEITIGGGVATSTHGSSRESTTLSSQVLAMEVVLADGSVKSFSRKEHPHLMRALRTNVGQLGVVTKLTLEIIPQPMLKRSRDEITAATAVARMKKLSDAYRLAKAKYPKVTLSEVVESVGFKDFLVLWFMTLSDRQENVWWIETEVDKAAPSVPISMAKEGQLQALLGKLHVVGSQTPPPTGLAQQDIPAVPKSQILSCFGGVPGCPQLVSSVFKGIVDGGLSPTTAPALFAYPTTRPEWFAIWALVGRTREYEVCIPLQQAGDAMAEILAYLEKCPWRKGSFRTPTGFRLVAEDDAYLSAGNGGPRICMEIDDFVGLNDNGDETNKPVEDIVRIMMARNGRMHWGKYGWVDFEPCFDGNAKWGDSWCQFGCAKMSLDPGNKFKSESTTWEWFATKNGSPVSNFAQCCSPDGFSPSCKCAPRPPATCSKKKAPVAPEAGVTHVEL
eukprot:TRINITY_DN1598_c0_g2_i1.p1 TRINITY_DN1598_c0_g2~~TRINITY_DN1598_c0_g2_i1.p1  ORF type:complete len:684 (+),score=86.02 TRINITY_DN1598_c0_g2_i1:83-2053(+)